MMQLARPAPASVAFAETVTATILLFGGHSMPGFAVAEAMAGPVVSRLIVTLDELVPPIDVALQVNVTPVVSLVTVCVSHPVVVTSESGSDTLHETPTLEVYQLPLDVPVTEGAITGGVVSD